MPRSVGREIAIKLLRPRHRADDDIIAGSLAEARVTRYGNTKSAARIGPVGLDIDPVARDQIEVAVPIEVRHFAAECLPRRLARRPRQEQLEQPVGADPGRGFSEIHVTRTP